MRALPLIAASALLLAAGCTDNYGRVDYGRTALLGVGVGAAVALAAGALNDKPRPYRGSGHRQPDYRNAYGGSGYGGGYGRPYRGGW